jgi:hypothetical protein
MGAMAELRPGPSEEQRRFKEAQRLQLQMDLQEQVSLASEQHSSQGIALITATHAKMT